VTFRRRRAESARTERVGQQLAQALRVVQRHEAGEKVDPDLLISALRWVVMARPDSAAIGVRLSEAYLARGSPGDVDQAIEQLERVVEVADPEQRRDALDNLWNVWLDRYEDGGELAHLEEAIKAVRLAAGEPQERQERAERLGYLGRMYRWRYKATGNADDMTAALEAMFAANDLTEGSVEQLPYTADIAAVLLARFDRDAVLDDLERGIDVLESVVRLATDQPELPTWLSNLSSALTKRAEITHARGDADRAVAVAEQGRRLAIDPLSQAQLGVNLGTALLSRHRHGSGNAGDVDRAIAVLEEARLHIQAPDIALPILLQDLGSAYGIRYRVAGREEDADRAIAFRNEALSVMPPGHPDRPLVLVDLGQNLRSRHAQRGDPNDLERGLSVLHEALSYGLEYRLSAALRAARELCDWSAERGAWRDAADAGRAGLEVLARQFRGQITLGHKKAWLKIEQRLPGRAAAALLRSGDREGAVLALERARTLLLAEAVADTEPLTFAQVAADPAVLVYLASSAYGGVALAVADGRVFARELPELTEDAVTEWVSAFLDAGKRRRRDPDQWQQVLDWTGEWLWHSCMRDALDLVDDVDELVLIPCGLLSILPLHAAWIADPARPTRRRYVLDDALITYAPSARAYHRARAFRSHAVERPVLTIADPEGVAPLPFAHVEVGALGALWHDAVGLDGAEATSAAVSAALPDAGVIHFACHGRADVTDPDAGGILLAHGELLSPSGLADLRLRARLAVLSGCETGVPGLEAPDEVAGLATSLLQAGAVGTVASLWEVPDVSTALLMVEFYRRWRLEGQPPAAALRGAQSWLRDATADELRLAFEPLLDGQGWLPSEVAEAFWEQVVLADPAERPFAPPMGWAAFVYSGF
jgi:hypothetical protein